MPSSFRFYKGTPPVPGQKTATPSRNVKSDFSGRTVVFTHEGKQVPGLVMAHEKGGKFADVRLGVPLLDGKLVVSQTQVVVEASALELKQVDFMERKVCTWNSSKPVELDGKMQTLYKESSDIVEDYRKVSIVGYGSTFEHVTPRDRAGDYVLPGAFAETITNFKKNPVMLVDHVNSVRNIAGSYVEIVEDTKGLRLVGSVSDAPSLKDVRFLIAEGHLKTLSMGGIWIFLEDGYGIEKVYLFEVSLVAIPCNPDAIFQSRSVDDNNVADLNMSAASKAFSDRYQFWLPGMR